MSGDSVDLGWVGHCLLGHPEVVRDALPQRRCDCDAVGVLIDLLGPDGHDAWQNGLDETGEGRTTVDVYPHGLAVAKCWLVIYHTPTVICRLKERKDYTLE